MLHYQTIYQIRDARYRLKKDYYTYGRTTHTKDADTMLVFTHGSIADQQAKENLNFLLDAGRKFNAELLVLHEGKIQFAGRNMSPEIQSWVLPADWCHEWQEWSDSRSIDARFDDSGLGESFTIRFWRRCFADNKTQGVYDVASGTRLTNRKETIRKFWALGFAAWRGRPLAVAEIRHTGTRNDLLEISELANKYWSRRFQSDVAKKIVSTYRSINRYAAWPGAW